MVRTKGFAAGMALSVMLVGGVACGGNDGEDKAGSATTPTTVESVAGAQSGSQSASPESRETAARMVQEMMSQVMQQPTGSDGIPKAFNAEEIEAQLRNHMNELLSQVPAKP